MYTQTPIVFCHRGNSEYLQYSLMQARKSNPDSEIILFGDESNRCFPFVTHVLMELPPAAIEFRQRYVHLSINSFEYELFCFLRWFIILSYCLKHKIKRCHYMDSDIMLYTDINRVEYQNVAWGMIGKSMGQGFFDIGILKEFCAFLLSQYGDDAVVQELREEYQTQRQAGNAFGICDMTFAEKFASLHSDAYLDLTKENHGAVFNDNIRGMAPNNGAFASNGKIMMLLFHMGIPHAYNKESLRWVRLNDIHCQGPDLKPLMRILWEAPQCNKPEHVLRLDEHWNWREEHLLAVLAGMPRRIHQLHENNSIDSLEKYALLLGYERMLKSLLADSGIIRET